MEFKFTTVVTHINTDEIYGLDFLMKNRCLVDVSSAKMYTRESEHELQLKGNFGCFIVSLKETVCLPPSSKMIFSDLLSLSEIISLCVRLKKRLFYCSQYDNSFARSSRLCDTRKESNVP